MKRILTIFLFLLTLPVFSQGKTPVETQTEMADLLRSNGKIYVVVGTVLIVLIGLLIYLISIDRKINKLESEVKNK
ncbi:MAG: CcmD family protein [Cytophagaceae bacterium]|nr:CcmD family protein [Cytophagaceae bacterium]